MTVGGIGGANASPQSMYGMGRQTDSYSRNIQNQIANAQKELQELSSNVDMTLEEKMKKRQEIQQEITNLNQQLRQHQMEQRKEQQSKGMSMDDMLGGSRNTAKAGNKGSGLSHAAMSAMISADSSMKQAKVQGGMAVRMEGSAGVLESEIKMDKSRGTDTKKKEEELANLQTRAEATTAAQISTLADAVKVMKEAEKEDRTAENADGRNEKTDQTGQMADREGEAEHAAEEISAEESGRQTAQPAQYTPVDIRL